MATDILLKLEGIKGESTIKGHEGEIDVLSWSWGMNNAASGHTGGGSGAGRVHIQDLHLTKHLDASTGSLELSCASGKPIKTATLLVRKTSSDTKTLDYFKIELTDVVVTSVHTGSTPMDEQISEQVTLNFKSVKTTYQTQDKTGGSAGSSPFGWDVSANAKI